MAILKRKRSDSELSFASSSAFSSPPRPGSSSFDFCSMAMDMDGRPSPFSPARSSTPSHLPSRTMKRFRDSRPSDEEVHRKFYEWRAHHQNPRASSSFSSSVILPTTEHTLGLLYSAQRNNVQPQRTLDHVVTAPTLSRTNDQPPTQRSLHSFWNLPTPASSSTTPSPSLSGATSPSLRGAGTTASNCEDCGAGLAGGSDDTAMEVDGFGEDCSCGACGKAVCFGCSVSNLGEQRRCLVCAGRKVWIGGIGWTSSAGVEVC